jgi:hypothetical protein
VAAEVAVAVVAASGIAVAVVAVVAGVIAVAVVAVAGDAVTRPPDLCT